MSIPAKNLIQRTIPLIHGGHVFPLKRLVATAASIAGLISVFAGTANAQVQFSVGVGQAYTEIQKAVDVCPATGCIINLTDSAYPLAREIWIEDKNNLTIQPSAQMKALNIRPRLYNTATGATEFMVAGTAANPTDPQRPAGWKKWPVKSSRQTGAGAGGDTGVTANPYSTSGFQNNGYVVVFKSTNITIDGVSIDGIKPTTFVNKGIWCGPQDCYDVFFGNVGINLFESKHVVVRGSEIKNCFAGIYIQNRNVGGAFAAPNPNDLDKRFIVPYSRFGKMGDHLVERNYIHNNWYVFYDEMEWDIGSTIRYNICDQNYNTQFAQNTDSSAESNNMMGGFMYLKDVRIVPHKIYNNTINGSSMIFGNSYFKPGVQHYFYNNIVSGWNRSGKNAAIIRNDRQYLALYKDFLYHNTFEVGQHDSLYQIQTVTSGPVNDLAACTSAGQPVPSCYLTWDNPVSLITNIKSNRWIWEGWMAEQGLDYKGTYKGSEYSASNNQNMDRFHQGGVIQFVKGLSGNTATNDISSQKNYWARKIPFKSSTPKAAGFMEPVWDSAIVDSTIRDKGWEAAGNLDLDGSVADRGAISAAGNGIISPLTLKDQFIVTLDKTAKTVSFQYCLDAQGAASGLDFEMTSYYRTIALSSEADPIPKPAFPAPIQLTNLGTKPAANSCGLFKASLPSAPIDSFARFDLVVKGMVDGKPTKSNVGVWVWRETQYKLDVYFTKSATGNDTITSARVGDPVYMHVVGRRSDNNSPIPTLDVLAATPDKNMFLLDPTRKQVMPGDTIGKDLTGGKGSFKVEFTSTGTVTIAMSGMLGLAPVPGSGAINIRPGLPERAIWQIPTDYMYADRSRTMDANATVMDQAPTAISLQVVDKFGNNVDTAAEVKLTALDIEPTFSQGFAALAAGPFNQNLFTSDATGKITGFNMVTGIEGNKFWGFATVVGKTTIDSALMKVGKPTAQLVFVPASKIDTFVTIMQKIHLAMMKDGKVVSTDPNSNSFVRLSSAYGSKLYASPTSSTALDSIALVSGEIDLWVSSSVPLANDTIRAVNPWIGNGVPAVFAPVTFRMPPKPPTPTMKSAVFLDRECDGIADSVVVAFDPNGAVPTLDPTKVRIDSIKFVLPGGGTVYVDSTQLRWIAGGASVAIALPASAKTNFPTYNPVAKLELFAALVRPPAADTIVSMGSVSVTDGIAPRPIGATLIENARPAQVADTLTVVFSEPVSYQQSAWPFRTFLPTMTETDGSGITVVSGVNTSPNTIKFILSGNTTGVVAENTILAIAGAKGISDLAGNDSRFAECSIDTARVVLKPSDVQVQSAALFDADGNGRADLLKVNFRREFRKASEMPDSLLIGDWNGAGVVAVTMAGADSLGAGSYAIKLATEMPLGATYGVVSGNGTLTLYKTNGVVLRRETGALDDSVPPIAVGVAKIEYGSTGDKLVVTYSEPMEVANPNAEAHMMLKSASGDLVRVFGSAKPDASGKIWSFDVPVGKLQVGDEIRLPGGIRSVLKAANGALPSTLGNAPYVPVVGGDRAPDSGVVLDRDGDGTADAVRLFYAKAPLGNPSFSFTWLGKTVSVDSTAYAGVVGGATDVTISVAGFPKGTQGTGSATSTSYVSGAAVDPIAFPLKDGVPPVLVKAFVSYGQQDGAPDTIQLWMSEGGSRGADAASLVLAGDRGASSLVNALSAIGGAGSSEFRLVCASGSCPGFGDSVRLAKGSVTDPSGAVVGDSSAWVEVTTGPKPIRYDANVYPQGVMSISKDYQSPLLATEPISLWVRKEGEYKEWTATGSTVAKWPAGTVDSAEVRKGLVGVKIDLNNSFDGQFYVYDNIGTFVGKQAVKLDVDQLRALGLVDGSNKYSVLVSLNGLDTKGKELASGVYMIRVIGYTQQTVNGQIQRVLQQNKLFKVGVHNKFK